MKRSNPAFSNEIATHLSGARNDKLGKRFCFLNLDFGPGHSNPSLAHGMEASAGQKKVLKIELTWAS